LLTHILTQHEAETIALSDVLSNQGKERHMFASSELPLIGSGATCGTVEYGFKSGKESDASLQIGAVSDDRRDLSDISQEMRATPITQRFGVIGYPDGDCLGIRGGAPKRIAAPQTFDPSINQNRDGNRARQSQRIAIPILHAGMVTRDTVHRKRDYITPIRSLSGRRGF
jgi:hypothetical protein